MISSLLARETNTINNILWIPSDNREFEEFFKTLRVRLFALDQIYLGSFTPELIISNDKTKHLEKIIKLTKYHQCPLILIDHEPKSDMIDSNKFQEKISNIPIVKQIAFSKQIKQSWGDIHELILNEDSDKNTWQDFIDTTKKLIYKYE
jgi:hypothetical protein